MNVAVIADVHANWHALDAVLNAVGHAGITEIWCLGDVVGYGPDPALCVRAVRERCAVVLSGNHELWAAATTIGGSGVIEGPLQLAKEDCSDDDFAWLCSRPPLTVHAGFGLMHGSPRDPVGGFIDRFQDASASLDAAPNPISFYGHTHVSCAWYRLPGARTVRHHRARPGSQLELAGAACGLINPGAVGRPQRDRHAFASWASFDTGDLTVRWHRADYDVAAVQQRILERDLNPWLAQSLAG